MTVAVKCGHQALLLNFSKSKSLYAGPREPQLVFNDALIKCYENRKPSTHVPTVHTYPFSGRDYSYIFHWSLVFFVEYVIWHLVLGFLYTIHSKCNRKGLATFCALTLKIPWQIYDLSNRGRRPFCYFSSSPLFVVTYRGKSITRVI